MKTKIGSAVLSVLIAFGLWLFVITSVSPNSTETYYDIPVILENESLLNSERGLMITDISAETATLRLSGNRSDLIRVNRGNITLKADLSTIYEPGTKVLGYTHSFPGDVPNNAFVVESKDPGYIQVTVERRMTKEIPVDVRWIGSADDGYMTDRENRQLDYATVSITGPESVVNTIEMACIEVDLNGRRESIVQSYQYTLCDANREPVDAQLITTNVQEVQLSVRITRVEDVPVACTILEGGGALRQNATITYTPASIRVSGSETALAALGSQLNLGTIDLAQITKNQSMTFVATLPEGITNLTGVNQVEVSIELSGLATKELMLENITAVNVPEGMEAELITEKMTVVARGPKEQIQRLTSGDIQAEVDFTGAEAGTANYRATIRFGEGFDLVGTLRVDPVTAALKLPEEDTEEKNE